MVISDRLLCLFSAQVEERDGSYFVEIPEQELDLGAMREGTAYRVAILPGVVDQAEAESSPDRESDRGPPAPPVEEGEIREVEIDDIGEQGDGIARVERGFVVIVPDTDQGERVRIEITDVGESVAFAEVVERLSYYD